MTTLNQHFITPLLSYKDSNNLAFHISGKDYSYSQFFDLVEQVFNAITGIPENLIGLYAADDICTYASIVALWLKGKTYIPLNPSQPKERHIQVIESVQSKYILSPDNSYEMDGVKIIRTSSFQTEGYQRKNNISLTEVNDNTLAYIIFTSGSTGKPKGVQITRRNVSAFIDSMNHIGLDITSADRCLQPFDLTFDFSVSSYVIPLVKGASIYTIPDKAVKFTYIAELIEAYNLTVLQMVPSMIRNLLPYIDEVDLSSVRCNILCGEALTNMVIKRWHGSNKEMASYNMYGPTENTVFCTYYKITKENITNPLANNDIVCIGKTFVNSDLLLLDDNDMIITKPNVEGELCLYGAQLTPGYWEDPVENSSKFFDVSGVRYYRSGDLCYYSECNNLMFVGRKDYQVKINGFRVELGEIENCYSVISGGKFSVVIPFVNAQGNTELAIVIEGREYDYSEHRSALANDLPVYEVPDKWHFIEVIPLNQNGKVDRKKIKQIFML